MAFEIHVVHVRIYRFAPRKCRPAVFLGRMARDRGLSDGRQRGHFDVDFGSVTGRGDRGRRRLRAVLRLADRPGVAGEAGPALRDERPSRREATLGHPPGPPGHPLRTRRDALYLDTDLYKFSGG